MSHTTTADFYKGMVIEFKSEPWQIIEFQHVNPGKGSAFVRTKLKHIRTGRAQEFTYKSGEEIEELEVSTREMQYLYKEGTLYHFMDNGSFEQFSVSHEVLGECSTLLKEGDTYQLLVLEDAVIGIRFPKKIRLKVAHTTDAVKGNTVGGATKEAELETGMKVQVPLFIKSGDTIALDTETNTYVERVSG